MIEELNLENYRCFSHLSMDFNPRLNIIYGDSGTGKTSLLRAIKVVLTTYFLGFKTKYAKFEGITFEDFNSSFDSLHNSPAPVRITFKLNGANNQILVRQNRNSKTNAFAIKELKARSSARWMEFNNGDNMEPTELFLFAGYTSRDIFAIRKMSPANFTKMEISRAFGYAECFHAEGMLSYWLKRLIAIESNFTDKTELQIVRNAFISALGPKGCNIIKDFEIRTLHEQVSFLFTDGREATLEQLSDGYKKLISLIIDLSFRCAILNKHLWHNNACQHTRGAVIIDDIGDLLQPSLQGRILASLRSTFPSLQFFISTHAFTPLKGELTDDGIATFKLSYMNDDYHLEAQTN